MSVRVILFLLLILDFACFWCPVTAVTSNTGTGCCKNLLKILTQQCKIGCSILAAASSFNFLDVASVSAIDWTDRNRLAAETWRTVDEIYFDRTFNGQDWYKMRQDVVMKNYQSDEEVYTNLQSMLAKLGDKYTRYLNPAQYAALLSSAKGELTGLGVELIADSGSRGTKVARLEDGSPAKEIGLQRGDVILNVDGTEAQDLSPEEVAAIMRGKEGSKVSVRVQRGANDILDFTALRKPIKLKGVTSSTLQVKNKKVGYIKVRSFATTTRDDVTQAMESLHREDALKRMDALVIDLRDNGGGALQGAVEASNLLLTPGKIVVFVVTREGNSQAEQTLPNGLLSADPALPDLTTPTYIWINANTASAAEVFAAAMKENGRATLVGEKSFGKGIIQNLQELRAGGVAVTTTRYETPSHNDINKRGIPVDKELTCSPDSSTGGNSDLATCIAEFI
mmetsp:Transcript_17027/g.28550  ORF Transcript_17027/g.28550 Transcript_17027/m.28550 type:complete len:452 (+) Transcript_17027:43-1398(+)